MKYQSVTRERRCVLTSHWISSLIRSTLHSNWKELNGSDEMECARVILQVRKGRGEVKRDFYLIHLSIKVLRKWPLFGCQLFEATDRLTSNRPVFIALHDTSIHILDRKHLVSYLFPSQYLSWEWSLSFLILFLFSIPYSFYNSVGSPFNSLWTSSFLRRFPEWLHDYIRTYSISRWEFSSQSSHFLPILDAHPEETTKDRMTFSMTPNTISEVSETISHPLQNDYHQRVITNIVD